jgi:hypothetical protein
MFAGAEPSPPTSWILQLSVEKPKSLLGGIGRKVDVDRCRLALPITRKLNPRGIFQACFHATRPFTAATTNDRFGETVPLV